VRIVIMDRRVKPGNDGGEAMPESEQDDIARAILELAGQSNLAPVPLTPDEQVAIARSKAAIARGEFATDEEVRAVWAKHGR
jgi:hypothetical protein